MPVVRFLTSFPRARDVALLEAHRASVSGACGFEAAKNERKS